MHANCIFKWTNEISATWSSDNTPDHRICGVDTFVYFSSSSSSFFVGLCRRRSGHTKRVKSVNYRPSSACKMWNLCGLITIWFVVRAHRMFIICLYSWFMCEAAGTLESKLRGLQVNKSLRACLAYENIEFPSKNLRNSKKKHSKISRKATYEYEFPRKLRKSNKSLSKSPSDKHTRTVCSGNFSISRQESLSII